MRIRNSCLSFFKENFNTNSLNLAIFFSLPIYINFLLLEYEIEVNFIIKIIFTVNLFLTLYLLFFSKHKWFGSGFFIGLFWFWWIGLSFRYYGLSWMIPIVDVLIALFYGFVFWMIFKIYKIIQNKNQYAAKVFLVLMFTFGFDYISPFTFDWLKPEILFVNTIFDVSKIVLFLVITSVVFYKELKWFSVLLLIFALFFKPTFTKEPNLDVYVSYTDVPQEKKWEKHFIPYEIKNNFTIINNAIKLKKDVVILPESAFPLFLNRYENLMDKLKKLSKKITIITGALHLKDSKYYNSTYIFENGEVKILDKHILVPFGEYIPLPFFEKEINDIFFSGASDYVTSDRFGIFEIKGYKFINAICYEATVEDLYKLNPKYVVALSNDAWFMPSIMPSLQQMLIKVYAKKYGKIVYHSINGFKSYVVREK
ncbi:apolipoprotein N-acyltransferase [Nautilia profundicola]|uniref:apolipoprotein N-acyltransferase n=1 Tax=Nautilia profundicola TaxID=244787 RepID=UPI00164FE22E|nr:apolipoprotein N-acyltransferase [Nautilia profundicola]